MQIQITAIDLTTEKLMGASGQRSFVAQVRGERFSGTCRFVPFQEDPLSCVGNAASVVFSQESVTDFQITDDERICITALREFGAYRICGIVASVAVAQSNLGQTLINVSVEDAYFYLTDTDTAGVSVSVGAHVEFVVHELCLWDEAL